MNFKFTLKGEGSGYKVFVCDCGGEDMQEVPKEPEDNIEKEYGIPVPVLTTNWNVDVNVTTTTTTATNNAAWGWVNLGPGEG